MITWTTQILITKRWNTGIHIEMLTYGGRIVVNNRSSSTNQGFDIPDSEYVCPDGKIFPKATKETMSFDQWMAALRLWLEWNPQIYPRELAHEILSRPEKDIKEDYEDGLSVQAVAIGIAMNYL